MSDENRIKRIGELALEGAANRCDPAFRGTQHYYNVVVSELAKAMDLYQAEVNARLSALETRGVVPIEGGFPLGHCTSGVSEDVLPSMNRIAAKADPLPEINIARGILDQSRPSLALRDEKVGPECFGGTDDPTPEVEVPSDAAVVLYPEHAKMQARGSVVDTLHKFLSWLQANDLEANDAALFLYLGIDRDAFAAETSAIAREAIRELNDKRKPKGPAWD